MDFPLYIEALYLIFAKLNNKLDQGSFDLTCHRFLKIQTLSLKRLDLSPHIDSTVLDKLLNRFRNLHSLSLHGNVTDIELTSVASDCPLSLFLILLLPIMD